jgi:hypothetical protein
MILLVLAFGATAPQADGQETIPPPSVESSDKMPTLYYFTHVKPRKELIEAELQAGPHEPWEGSFATYGFHGPWRGWLITRKFGYVSTSRVVDMGTVEVKGTRIVLNSEAPGVRRPDRPVFEVVRWGERAYLVKPTGFVEFCNDVNSGRVRAHDQWWPTTYLMRDGDEKKKVDGAPEVPEEYKKYLLDKPITATATEAHGEKNDVAVWGQEYLFNGDVVTLNVGKKNGVRSGMKFYSQERDDWGHGYVISVAKERCELLVESWSFQGDKSAKPGVQWTTVDPRYTTPKPKDK